MADDKTSVKEAISAIRGMSATFRAFAAADVALAGLMGLDSTRESIELCVKEAQKELDALNASKKNVADEIAREDAELGKFRSDRMKEIDAKIAAYLAESEKKCNDQEDALALAIAKLHDKKSVLEFDVSNLSEVVARRDAILVEIAELNGKCTAEQARLDGIKFEIAAFKNRL
jgi:peptidoglycan hydrolase CwlO-like protein